jgi:hypothetical protein
MTVRVLFCAMLTIIATNSCFADEFWPPDISHRLIQKYVQQGQNLNTDNLQAEYDYVLIFLERAMTAHRMNIVNFFTEDSLIKYEPVLENGKLVIKEVTDTSNILVLVERFLFSVCFSTYNQLIDFWYARTGLMIRERLSSEVEEEVRAFIMSNDSGIEVRELTPKESAQVEAVKRELGWIQ